MKILKQIFLTMTMVVGLSFAVSAQDKDQKQRPPKDPPVIVPGDKPKDKPKENRPKEEDRNKDNRGKKPQMVVIKTAGTIETEYV